MLKIATWNVNSVNARLPNVIEWLETANPDVVLLQEIKTTEENFPNLEFSNMGYNVAVFGQKSYNGVAILSKRPIEDVRRGISINETDEQARYIEAFISGIRIASIYLPNGNPINSDKFRYKINWMVNLIARARKLFQLEECTVLAGDYNIIPSDEDVYDPIAWKDDALCHPEARTKFREILNIGYVEAFRSLNTEAGHFTFWDYQKGRWPKDEGLRIDHLLLSPEASDRLDNCEIDRTPRSKTKPSDHTPIWCTLHEDP